MDPQSKGIAGIGHAGIVIGKKTSPTHYFQFVKIRGEGVVDSVLNRLVKGKHHNFVNF